MSLSNFGSFGGGMMGGAVHPAIAGLFGLGGGMMGGAMPGQGAVWHGPVNPPAQGPAPSWGSMLGQLAGRFGSGKVVGGLGGLFGGGMGGFGGGMGPLSGPAAHGVMSGGLMGAGTMQRQAALGAGLHPGIAGLFGLGGGMMGGEMLAPRQTAPAPQPTGGLAGFLGGGLLGRGAAPAVPNNILSSAPMPGSMTAQRMPMNPLSAI
jgi:hypothetical protein